MRTVQKAIGLSLLMSYNVTQIALDVRASQARDVVIHMEFLTTVKQL